MFFFFYFDEKNICTNSIIKKAFEIVLIRKLKSDKYCDLKEFIQVNKKKGDVKMMLTQINSPFAKLFDESYPNINSAAEKWNKFESSAVEDINNYTITYNEAWCIVYWVYCCYANIRQRKDATIEALSIFYKLYDLKELGFYDTFIFLKEDIEINIINSVNDFLRELGHIEKEEKQVFFRGHADATYLLLPSIMRKEGWYKHERDIYNQVVIECSQDFKECTSHLEYLVHMQHYGVPTRLLDITKNPLVALYFACESQEDKNGEIIVFDIFQEYIKYAKSDSVTILASLPLFTEKDKKEIMNNATNSSLDKESFNIKIKRLIHEVRLEKPAFLEEVEKKDITSAFFVLPEKKNSRIVKQDGAFIICGLFSEEDNVINKYRYEDNGKKQIYIIKSKQKRAIINELDKLSINKASLFPEIEDVAEYIKQKFEYIP